MSQRANSRRTDRLQLLLLENRNGKKVMRCHASTAIGTLERERLRLRLDAYAAAAADAVRINTQLIIGTVSVRRTRDVVIISQTTSPAGDGRKNGRRDGRAGGRAGGRASGKTGGLANGRASGWAAVQPVANKCNILFIAGRACSAAV